LGEAISGSVYCKAYNQLIADPEKQLFVPIIQWIDCTSVTGNDCFSLKPYMFIPAIITKKNQKKYQGMGVSWISAQEKSLSAQKQTLCMGDSIQNYHEELNGVLESIWKCSPQVCGVYLPIGCTGKNMR
jgi:hypothetical protein